MNRDAAVRAAAEALRIESLNYANAAWATRWAAAAVDAAAPHLTEWMVPVTLEGARWASDLVRERDEALAAIARVEAELDRLEAEGDYNPYGAIRAAVRGDQKGDTDGP